MKAVFDTNVLLAVFLTEGVCAKLLTRARKRQFDLVACPFILHEFDRILTKKFSATRKEAEGALALITEAAQDIVHPSGAPARVCRDKDDDHVLACAREAAADYLVTGDRDLLAMKAYRGTRIIAPRDFELLFGD